VGLNNPLLKVMIGSFWDRNFQTVPETMSSHGNYSPCQ